MPEGQQPRGVTLRPTSGAATSEVRGIGQVSYPESEAKGRGWEQPPTPEARSGSWEEQPHVQGAIAAQSQESVNELSHIEGQEGQQ